MPDSNAPPAEHEQDERAQRARQRRLDFTDRIAARLISLGGVLVVLSVIAIVLFVGAGALPLLMRGDAALESTPGIQPAGSTLLSLIEDYRESVLLVGSDGRARVLDLTAGEITTEPIDLTLTDGRATVAASDLDNRLIAVGDDQGRVHLHEFSWRVSYTEAGRQVQPDLRYARSLQLFEPPAAIARLAVSAHEDTGERLVAQSADGRVIAYAYDAEWDEEYTAQLEIPAVAGAPGDIAALALNSYGERLVVGSVNGQMVIFDLGDLTDVGIIQVTRASDTAITSAGFLLGGTAIIIGDASGVVQRWLPVRSTGPSRGNYRAVGDFARHAAPVVAITPSRRDRSFLTLDHSGTWHLNHGTSGRTYEKVESVGEPALAITLAPRADGVVAITADGGVASWRLSNPHPEATTSTLFGRVWYEGYDKPEFVWQSTGGTDEFEPKLSLIPLVFGTVKGTVYAMLFSVPVALLAAIYVSQLGRPKFRSIVKPTIELMAAIPSVVVGFLAALWLAPIIEAHLIATGLSLLSIPISAVIAALAWHALPRAWRERTPDGLEPAVGLPFIVAGITVAFALAPLVESWLFGGDVRQWLFSEHGIRFDPRNNIVVGFALGIAVIPIIFTVSEDALSNVPRALVSGALALGASPWQATWRIVLRAASPGIFAAIMLGFGRAVGETMIVLMATGNTPIMDWSIFNGMRTMSAAIAVEIPEAPLGGTLYRVLFLVAFLLFIFTLLVNTAASVVGTRLRRRYGRF
jgi:phosphate transport system permease protein